MNPKKILPLFSILLSTVAALGQGAGVSPQDLLLPLKDSWPTYNGDYSGKRYSLLTQVNRSNVKNLTLGWMTQLTEGAENPASASEDREGRGDQKPPVIVGGEGPGNIIIRDGHELWHYYWKTRGGTHIGNRGFGMWHNYLYMETPDDYLVSLDAKTGKERWHKTIADVEQGYFSTPAPIVIGNHVLVGVGNDIDSPGFLQSFDPETGDLQWKHYTVPMQKGDPGLDTWASLDAARHGGAQTWMAGAYDPETNLYIFGTGNPTPAYTTGTRGDLDNLFTCSLVAINVDTGKMAWYYQTSPHDMHDYDSAQVPVLFDGMFNGKMRKMVLTAARNGYYFTLDRVTGERLVSSKYGLLTNWANRFSANGEPMRDPSKDPTVPGSLVSPNSSGTVNWEPPAFSPSTGLLYVPENNTYSIFYLTDIDPRGSMGLGGREEAHIGSGGDYLTAIDYKTGKAKWRHRYEGAQGGGGGILATAGGLVFAGDGSGSLVAHDAATGVPLWNTRIGEVTNAPQTYLLDGHQYVICATGDRLWSFLLY
jgi:alcohol dehydrogenase (cytochrome c)